MFYHIKFLVRSDPIVKIMAGETVVETPQDNTKVDEPVKTDKEVIAEEEAAQANEVIILILKS